MTPVNASPAPEAAAPAAEEPRPAPAGALLGTASGDALARNAFLAAMSHELRTPMVGVLGFAELLSDTPLDPQQRDCVRAIRDCGQELLATIDDVLVTAALAAGAVPLEPRPIELRPVLDELVRSRTPAAAAKRIGLALEVAPDVPHFIVADPARLVQVLGQLLENAIKFTDAGAVRVEVRRDATAVAGLRFTVRDTGCGLPPAARDELFRPFGATDFSRTRPHGGVGLGLAICRGLVELMGGTIAATAGHGVGATIEFTVPLASAASEAAPAVAPGGAAPGAPAGAAAEAAEVRVLVAEDHPVNQRIVRRVLEQLGCRVDLAADGGEAVALASLTRYDLICMDCHMPRLDGFEATREIRRREPLLARPRTPIVALTASAPEADREQCFAAGMDAFLRKPVDAAELRGVLRRFTPLGQWPAVPAPAPAAG